MALPSVSLAEPFAVPFSEFEAEETKSYFAFLNETRPRYLETQSWVDRFRAAEKARPTYQSCFPTPQTDITVDLTMLDYADFASTDEIEVCLFRVLSRLNGVADIHQWMTQSGLTTHPPLQVPDMASVVTISGGINLRERRFWHPYADRWDGDYFRGRPFQHSFGVQIDMRDGQFFAAHATFNTL